MVVFNTGKNEIKLELNMINIMNYEKQAGKSIYDVLTQMENDRMPSISDIVMLIKYAANKYNHGVNDKIAVGWLEEYCENHMPIDFVAEYLLDIYKDAGLITVDNSEESEVDETEVKDNMFRD